MLNRSFRTWLVSDDSTLSGSIEQLESAKKPLNLSNLYSDELSKLPDMRQDDILIVHLGSEGLAVEQVVSLVKTAASMVLASRVIVIDDEHSSSRGITLHKAGVGHYLSRPLNLNQLDLALEVLRVDVSHPVVARKEKSSAPVKPRADVNPRPVATPVANNDHGYLTQGGGALYDNLLKSVTRVAKLDTTVLLTGETGTGKSHLARYVHQASDRREMPFITINCAAISPMLFESELFGHVRGSFTGAETDRTGKLTEAAEGTIFLDEIDSLPLALQAKLLRVFEEKVYEPVGSNKTLPMKARLIVASNRDLKTEVSEGRFRSDLFYRLNVVSFEVPALRLRKSLISDLLDRFLDESSSRMCITRPAVTPEAMELMHQYDWPGNIRELRNVVERAVALCDNNQITPAELTNDLLLAAVSNPVPKLINQIISPDDFKRHTESIQHRLSDVVESQEREMILESVNRNGFNLLRTAKDLGISRMTLYKKLEKYQIQRKGCREVNLVVSQVG